MSRIIYPLFLIILFSSCSAYQIGNLNSSNIGAKFIYEDLAIGVAKADRFLGLGGIRKDALVAEAKRQLMTARPLMQGEEYINFTIDFKHSYIFLVDRTKVTVTADVIRHTDMEPKDRYSQLYLNKMFIANYDDNLFKTGDYVITEHYQKGQILGISKNRKATLALKNRKGEIKTRNIKLKKLYNRTTIFKGLKAGDNYILPGIWENFDCKIIGLGKTKILLLKPNGFHQRVDYPQPL